MNKDNYVIKQANVNIDDISEKGILSGYANVYNIEDTDGDISQVGSFTKTVTENRKRIKILKNHDRNQFVGIPIELDPEDSHGLRLTTKMLLETPIGKQAYEESKFLVENGFESGFSIGGWVLKRSKANSQIVTEYKLNEISVLTCDPANQLSVVDTIKSMQKQSEFTQEQFWKAITKAYDNHKFDDSIIKSLEQFLSLNEKGEPSDDTHKSIEPTILIQNIYKNTFNKMEKTEEQIKKEAMDNIKDVATKSAEARFEEMKKEFEPTFETLAKAQELKDLNEKVTNLGVELKKQAQFKQENEKSTFNENIAKAIQENAEAIKNHKRGSGEITLTMKEVGDMSIGNNFVGATPFIQDVRTNLIAQPFNRVWLADLMPQGTSAGNSVLYPKEAGGEGAVGAWDGTGEKPQVDYDFESQSAFFKWIAGYVIVEREMLDDIPWLISYLQNRLLIDLKRAENDFVLNGRTGTNPVAGLLATAKAYDGDLDKAVDRIIDSAYGQVPEKTFDMYTGNIAVLNPRDIVKIGLNKADGSGEYDLPGDNVRFNNGVLNIGGINAVSTTGIDKNDFLTFDRNATMFLRRMSPEIRMFEDAELAKVNKVMFRVEERVTQVIFNDEALVKGDFTITPEA